MDKKTRKFKSFSKDVLFESLMNSSSNCNLCERMDNRTIVLSRKNGKINAKVLFIAEAPGRLGADKTKVPLKGDKAGDNFEMLLNNIGWNREDLFITNAVLCNPRDANGNNGTPTVEEISNCNTLLNMTINFVNPEIIVTLGITALKGLHQIKNHPYSLKSNVAQPVPWNGRILFIAYHPGQRAMVHRSRSLQRSDFYKLRKLVDPLDGLKDRKRRNYKMPDENEMRNIKTLTDSIVFLIQH